jgi:Mlc titration factor MtfA (ptsG expression regulator)
MFSWFRDRNRRKLLAQPFPAEWEGILRKNVGHYSRLDAAQQQTLRNIATILIAEKVWEGCGGQQITPEVQVTTAGQAALLVLAMEHDHYARVPSIIVYPTAFQLPEHDETGDEFFIDSDRIAEGQAVYRGPVILGWDQVLREGRDPEVGQNVVVHEFAHQLDFLDGQVDGVPPLETRDLAKRWQSVMAAGLADHRKALERGEETFFTEHAGENEAEFFADASEAFFCLPHDFHTEHPNVFELLLAFYRLDPRKWFE